MTEPFFIRRCTPADAEQVLEVWRAAAATPSLTDNAPEIVRAASTPTMCFVVAEAQGRLVGTAMGGFDGWRGNMYRLAVRPEYRRQGVARALVAAIERHFAATNVTRVSALVEHDHPLAVAFWSALGYARDARISRFVKTLAGSAEGP